MKEGEHGEQLIVRFWEVSGQYARFTLYLQGQRTKYRSEPMRYRRFPSSAPAPNTTSPPHLLLLPIAPNTSAYTLLRLAKRPRRAMIRSLRASLSIAPGDAK